jgi:internalin A
VPSPNTPVIFLAVAASQSQALRDVTLRDVSRERTVLRKVLEKAAVEGQCILLEAEVARIEDVFQVFRSYPQRISIFHYAGHGSEDALLLYLENAAKGLTTSALTTLLAESSIKLVFLNCCSSQSHAEALLGAGVPVVIATSSEVHDDIACDFAQKFYEGLANGHTIKRAFELSKSELMARPELSTALLRGPALGKRDLNEQARHWNLYANKHVQGAETWQLSSGQKDRVPLEPLALPSAQRTGGKTRQWLTLAVISLLIVATFVMRKPLGNLLGFAITPVTSTTTPEQPLCQSADEVVTIPDAKLETALRNTLNISDEPLTCGVMLDLSELHADSKEIHTLEGLQYATNLRRLNLEKNEITDISALEGLSHLQKLVLSDNPVTNLSPLQNLVSLGELHLPNSSNGNSDISPLAHLTGLEQLGFSGYAPDDISDLAGLTNLTTLWAWNNALESEDMSALAGKKLKLLSLGNNHLTDISFLKQFPELEGLSLTKNNITDITTLRELPNLTSLKLVENAITDVSALVANPGLALGDVIIVSNNFLDLTPGSEDRTNLETLLARGVDVTFEPQRMMACANPSDPVNIPDANLLGAIRAALDQSSSDITCLELATLTELAASEQGITNLAGLEYAVNLQELELGNNHIADATVLSGLTNLEGLHLWGNPLKTYAPLASLTNLKRLYLGDMTLADMSPLYSLSKLEILHLSFSGISDLSFLTAPRYPRLKELNLAGNNLRDISPLQALDKLERIILGKNKITDITPLVANAGLAEGAVLYLEENLLDIKQGSADQQNIVTLTNRGVLVSY